MVTPALVVREEGRIAVLTRSRKYHRCGICQQYIDKGSQYYAITLGGGGLGSIKFPSRVHIECLDKYWERVRKSREL